MSLLYAPAVVDASRRAVGCDCLAHRYGNAADRPERRAVYPTDLTDGQWAVIVGLIPVPAWIGGRGGRPEGYCHREMIDAMLYVDDNGTKWRALPADFPDWLAAYRFFRRWRDQGLLAVLRDRLRRACREAARARTRTVGGGDQLAVAACRRDRRRGRLADTTPNGA